MQGQTESTRAPRRERQLCCPVNPAGRRIGESFRGGAGASRGAGAQKDGAGWCRPRLNWLKSAVSYWHHHLSSGTPIPPAGH